ncbi:MAG: DUF1304 domain-containing protein [Pseudomonadota bacterium]|nr:DUF1304 domain-containing protein [Pseudomonadota bacterium]
MIAYVLTGLVALIHIYIVYLEMVLWTQPRGRKAFGTTEAFAEESKTLAANQGLYNGFLAAGLIYGMVRSDVEIMALFLVFVLVAGLYGGLTVSKRILVIQSVPAALALVALALGV